MNVLISVSDKTGIVEFVTALKAKGYNVISTGGTKKALESAGIDVIGIEDVTQFPEMLDGRVKTLHPKVFGGILAKRDNNEHMTVCGEHQINMIDIVVVNLYPFESVIQKPDTTHDIAIENIDIGGPSLIRAAAKNFKDVYVVVNPDRYQDVLHSLDSNDSLHFKKQLASEAFAHCSHYNSIIHNYFEKELLKTETESFPDVLIPAVKKIKELRYGENPHQKAALYQFNQELYNNHFQQLNGKELSYNNIIDLESAWNIVKEFNAPGSVVIKHTNPCGAAVAEDLKTAYVKSVTLTLYRHLVQ